MSALSDLAPLLGADPRITHRPAAGSRADPSAMMEATLAQYDHFRAWITGMAIDGDTVKVSAESSGHHKTAGDYGQDYELTFRFRDGRCVYVREFVDSLYSKEFFARAGMLALVAPKG